MSVLWLVTTFPLALGFSMLLVWLFVWRPETRRDRRISLERGSRWRLRMNEMRKWDEAFARAIEHSR